MNQLQIAVYARVSSEQQTEAGTIESQLAALREKIRQEGQVLLTELTFIDDGYSGANLIRPGLEQLRDVVAMHGIDRLYVHSPDRLARKYAYQVLLMDEFQRAGVEVIFLNRSIGQSPEDDLLLQVQGMIAEYERSKILERSRRGKRHAAMIGQVSVLCGAPYGYRYIKKHEGAGGQALYTIIPSEAKVVRQIFQWVGRERVSIGEVCRRLQKAGEPTRTGKTTWDRTTVWGILKNPAYKGKAAFGKTQTIPRRPKLRLQRGDSAQPRRAVSVQDVSAEKWILIEVPALVREELFEAVQTQLEENRRHARQRRRGARYLLQGLIVCAKCRYAYYGKPVSNKSAKGHRRNYAYYRCIGTDAYRFGGERICDNLQVRTDLVDECVWQEVRTLLSEPRRIAKEYQRRLTCPDKEGENLVATQGQLARIRQGIGRLIDSYSESIITKAEFEPRIDRLRQRQKSLEQKIRQLQSEISQQQELRLIITCLEEFAGKVQKSLADADWLSRRELIRMLVKRVEIDKEGINVVFRITPDPFEAGPHGGRLQHCGRRGLTSAG
jgi:site-specific DNA recombinase